MSAEFINIISQHKYTILLDKYTIWLDKYTILLPNPYPQYDYPTPPTIWLLNPTHNMITQPYPQYDYPTHTHNIITQPYPPTHPPQYYPPPPPPTTIPNLSDQEELGDHRGEAGADLDVIS